MESSDNEHKKEGGVESDRSEIERLRQENAELRARLESAGNVPAKPTFELPAVAPADELELPLAPDPLPSIDGRSPVQDKIRLFRTLFRGRDDVHAVFWQDERTGRKGYKPVCEGYPTKAEPKKYLPLTDAALHAHLSGKATLGLYPLLEDNSCWFLACDFDKTGWLADAVAYLEVCKDHRVPAYLERSRSGNGGHVWMFFSAPVAAVSARQLGMRLLRQTMDIRGDLDMASYDRFFPNQDFRPKGGFGNLIALPFQKKRRILGNTEFVDPSAADAKSWPDQWAFLSRVTRLSPAHVEALLESVPPMDVGPGQAASTSAALIAKHPAPQAIRCTLSHSASVEKSGLPPWLLSKIRHSASLHNPEFYQRQKLRYSTYQTPRFIRCYDEDISHLHLPRGTFESLRAIASAVGSSFSVEDRRPEFRTFDFQFKGSLTQDQEQAVRPLLKHEIGVLVAPPGAGKTVMGCYVAAKRNVPTLILAHRKPLLDQWRVHLIELLGLASRDIGQIGGGRDRQSGVVDLAMFQSLARRDDPDSILAPYGLIIVDECHHVPAVQFAASMKKVQARFVLGLTATPYRRDGLHGLISMQCGPTRHEMAQKRGDLPLTLVVRETAFGYLDDEMPIQELYKKLSQDGMRNDMIVRDVLEATDKGRRCLVLSQRKDHCAALAAKFLEKGRQAFVLSGVQGKKERVAILKDIQGTPPENPLIVLSTGQYLGEGFDCPQMDTLFMASPASFKGRLVQYAGRILREYPGKTEAVVYDYLDSQVDMLRRMYSRRSKAYKTLGAVASEE